METSSPHDKEMVVGSQQETAMEVNDEVACKIDFNLVDNVQTPVGNEIVIYGEDFEGKTLESLLNMRFKTEDEAFECYNDYARKMGFKVRKDRSHKAVDGILRSRRFCCSREGFKRNKPDGKVKRRRDSTRTGCNAHIFLKLEEDGIYTIVRHETDHNHMCTPKKADMFRSQRHISIAQAFESDLADSVEISAEARGLETHGFLSVDYKNYLQLKRLKPMVQGDAGGVLQYLENMLVKDPGSIYKMQVDEDDKICNIFWADSKMVSDYHAFGDVVCFDTTYKTNDYDRPFAPFIGVNHHRQTIVFGVALMYDETIPSFQFVFESFLIAMSGVAPTTILTDQDKAMACAISKVMPNTYHRICVRHMHQKIVKHLHHIYTNNKSFKEDFNKCMYEYEEEIDFLDAWERMLEKYNLRDNAWLKNLFEEREKWALVYGRNTFCANMKSTQQSESMNSVIRKYLHRSHKLQNFFVQWDMLVEDRRKKEDEADFIMTQSTPNLMMNVPMLVNARNMYTSEIFKLFQDEYEKGMGYTVVIECMEGTNTTYKVHSSKQKRDYIVTFDSELHTVECCCKKFEFDGILCGHALSVLYRANLEQVPNKYILRRWRKDARQHTINTFDLASKGKMTTPTRYKELMCTSVRLSNMAAINQEAFELALDGIVDLMKKIQVNGIAASLCEPPNDMGAKPKSDLDICDMVEKGLKGEKKKKSALEKARTNGNKSAKAKAPKDCTSIDQSTNAEAPMDNWCIPSSDQIYQAHLPTLSMDQPCMNQKDQHQLFTSATSQTPLVMGMRSETIESVECAPLPTASKSDGSAPANIRMERPSWLP